VLLPDAASARPTGRDASGSGLSLTGPLSNIMLCTKYSYRVNVLSDVSYKETVVTLHADGAALPQQLKNIHLTAHRRWTGIFSETFTTTAQMSKLEVGVTVLPPHRGYKTLFHKVYAVTPATSQPPNPAQFCGNAPPPSFGS
jgi:hypothetical protein